MILNNRVPYLKLYNPLIGDLATGLVGDISTTQSIIGVISASFEIKDFKGFVATVKIVIPQEFYSDPGKDAVLTQLFTQGTRWILSFGWVDSEIGFLITDDIDCSLFSASAEYNEEFKGFDCTLVFFSTIDDLLYNVPIELLTETKKLISASIQDDTNEKSNLSIYNVIDQALKDVKNLVETNEKFAEYRNDKIPTITDLLFCVTDSPATDAVQTFEKLIKGKMVNDTNLALILNSKEDLKLYYWIRQILKENGFVIAPALWRRGFKYIIFLPAVEKDNYSEEEFLGPYRNETRNTYTWVDEYDLFSQNSRIIEISLGSVGANKTLEEILATEKLAKESEPLSPSDNKQDVDGKTTLLSLYSIWKSTSKNVDMTILGNVGLFIWDNIYLYTQNRLFDGTYKIIAVKHTITKSRFVTKLTTSRVSPDKISFRNPREDT